MDNTTFYIIVAGLILVYLIFRKKDILKSRKVLESYSAKLEPVETNEYVAGGEGAFRRIYYQDGNSELKLRIYGTNLPARTTIMLNINGYTIREIKTSRGGAYLDLDSRKGISVPLVSRGDMIEIIFDGKTVLSGTTVRK